MPGSGSYQVDAKIKRFEGASSEQLGVVLQSRGGDAGQLEAAVDRVDAAAGKVENKTVTLSDDAAAVAKQDAAQQDVVLMPLVVRGRATRRSRPPRTCATS